MRKKSRLLILMPLLGATLATGGILWIAPRRHEARLMRAPESELRTIVRQSPGDGIALYYLALARQKAADTVESERLLKASLQADPTRPLTWLALATLTESKGDSPHAEQILKEMLERFPENATAHVRLSNLLLARDAPTAAHAHAKRATALAPGDAEGWITLGRISLSTDRLPEARTALEQAARLQPNAWQIAFSRGHLSMTQKSFSEAATHYRQAVTTSGESVAWLALAHSLVRSADPTTSELSEAETSLQKAAALEKTVPLYPQVAAKLRMHQKRWDEALESLAAARLLDSANPEIVFDQGIALRALGRTTEARAASTLHRTLAAAQQRRMVVLSDLAQKPTPSKTRTLRLELARIYRTQGRLWDARRTLEGLGETDPSARVEIAALDQDPRMTAQRLATLSEAVLVADGNSLIEQQKYEEAQLRFQEAVRRNASNAIALQGVGLSLLHQGRSLQAVPYFTQAANLAPDLIASQFYLGERALEFGLAQEAIRRLEKASQLAPDDPEVWYRFHQALGLLNSRVNDRISALQKCVTLTPDNLRYRLDLGEVLADAGKTDDAEKAFRGALALAPDSVETQARLGGFLAANRRMSSALAEASVLLNRVRKADPRHAYARFSLGTLAMKQGRAAEAVPLLRELTRENPQLQESWYLLSRAYAAIGKTSESQEALRHSRQIQQESVDFLAAQEKLYDNIIDPVQRLKVARLCQKHQQPLKAMAHYRILLSQKPDHPEALREKAILEQRLAQTGLGEKFAAYEEMLRASSHAAEKETH